MYNRMVRVRVKEYDDVYAVILPALMSAGVSMLVMILPVLGSSRSHIFTIFLSVEMTVRELLWGVEG